MFYHKSLKSTIFSSFVFLFLLCGSLLFSDRNAFSYMAKVTANRLNIRVSPSLDAEILGTVSLGEVLLVKRDKGLWTQIFLPENLSFWVHSQFLKKRESSSTSEGVVLKDGVNLRVEPNVTSLSIGKLFQGQIFPILDERFEWYRIVLPESSFSAWVYREHIKKTMTFQEYTRQSLIKKQKKIYHKIEQHYFQFFLSFQDMKPQNILKTLKKLLQEQKGFLQTYPDTEFLKILKKRIVNCERKLLECEWDILEKRFSLFQKDHKRAALLTQLYKNFEKKFPKSSYSDTIKKRFFFLQQLRENEKKAKKRKKDSVFSGFVEDLGTLFRRPKTYKLLRDKKLVCFIRSKTINLASYRSSFVELRGQLIRVKGWKTPILEVSSVSPQS